MKIGLCIESSTKSKAPDVSAALSRAGLDFISFGMTGAEEEPDLTYIETGFLSALFLNLGIVDIVVGGCGTGQGYFNSVLQYPGVSAGLILEPVDAFLFSQINAGNVVVLALNKGYGSFGADINLDYIFEKLFVKPMGSGYPKSRAPIQIGARKKLSDLSQTTHFPMGEILQRLEPAFIRRCVGFPHVLDYIRQAPDSAEKQLVLSLMAAEK